MADKPKRALAETLDNRPAPRRDPRAEPESLRDDGSDPPHAYHQDLTGIGPHSPIKTPPESETRMPAAKIDSRPTLEELGGTPRTSRRPAPKSTPTLAPPPIQQSPPIQSLPVQAPPDSRSSLDSKSSLDSAGASGIAVLRRQLAALQMQISEAQSQLGQEQVSRAEDAEEMARVLLRLASSEAESETLRDDLGRERAFVEELRVSVREKYEDCNALRQKLADAAESLIAKELEEAAERHTITERAEQRVAEVNKQLEVSRASEESTRTEMATLSTQLDILRRAFEKQEAELAKSSAALKNANMKAFAANKQLESWKSESQRMMEQARVEQEVVLAKINADHAKLLESAQRDTHEAEAWAAGIEKQAEGAADKLALLTRSLETLEEAERKTNDLRAQAQTARRGLLEQATQARQGLAIPPRAPKIETATAPPEIVAIPGATPSLSRPPVSGVQSTGSPVLAPVAAPPAASALAPAAKLAAGARVTRKSDPPLIEFGEIEMGADDLVQELIEAKNRSGR